METTMIYWGLQRVMENQIETTIMYWGLHRVNGKSNGNYCDVLVVT